MKLDTLREKDIEAKLGRYAKAKGCLYFKFTSPSQRSVPDRIIISPQGAIGFLELKRKGNRPTAQQEHELRRLIDHGVTASWVDNFEDGRQFIDDLLTAKHGRVFLQGRACVNADGLLKGGADAKDGVIWFKAPSEFKRVKVAKPHDAEHDELM